MARPRKVDVDVIVVCKTDKAVLINDGDREVWLSLASVDVGTVGPGKHAVVTMPERMAIEKELV